MIAEAHLHLRQNIKREVRARTYEVHAVRCTSHHITEKTTYYPDEIDRMKKTTRRRKFEIKIEKVTNPKGKGQKKVQVRQGSNKKQEFKKGNTQENAQFFADYGLAPFARGVEQILSTKKDKHTYSATKNTWETKKRD